VTVIVIPADISSSLPSSLPLLLSPHPFFPRGAPQPMQALKTVDSLPDIPT